MRGAATRHVQQLKLYQIYLLLAPGLVIYLLVTLFPLLTAVFLSFYKTKGINLVEFVGLKNYAGLIRDSNFFGALFNNLYIILLCMIGQVVLGLVIALLITHRSLIGAGVHRVMVFTPVVLAPVVIGIIWTIIYRQEGLLNGALNLLGLGSLIRLWLDDPKLVMTCATIPIIWQCIGFYAVIYMAALTSIPQDCLESAQIDGAGGLQRLWYITLPLIRGTIFICVVLAISGNMKLFDHIFAMTKGGPGRASMVLALYAYQNMFKFNRMDYGSTVSVGIMMVSLVLVFVTRRVLRGESIE